VKLVDIHEVKATFYLPNAELAAARPGAKAKVIADAWPDLVFEGVVRTVATKAEFTPRNIQTRSDRDRLVYPVEVWIENREAKLRPGMPVQVVLPGTER
jgi:HlyD family secretion protein